MTGPEHYKRAEELIRLADAHAAEVFAAPWPERVVDADKLPEFLRNQYALAQVHATLALAAATAQNIRRNNAMDAGLAAEWAEALS